MQLQKRSSLLFILLFTSQTVFSQFLDNKHGSIGGFPNITQTAGTLLSGNNLPNQGRVAIIAFHNGLLYTVPEHPSSQPGSDLISRSWDISDPTSPQVLETFGSDVLGGIMAHGHLKSGDYLVIGGNWPPSTPGSFISTSQYGVNTRTQYPELNCIGVRGCLFQPWGVSTFWSYDEVSGDARLWFGDFNTGTLAQWDHLGLTGVIGHPFIIGNLLIMASDQSRTGVATYDISDPTNPILLDVLTTGGAGGYWPELWGSGDGHLYVVFPYRTGGNGMRVVDVSDPSNMQFVADVPLAGRTSPMYVQFQDEYAFIGDHKIDMRNFQSVLFFDGENQPHTNDAGVGIDLSQFALPLGNLLVTGGQGVDQGMAIWAHQSAADLRGPYVGYHIPRSGQTNYPVSLPISVLIHETLETPTIINGTSVIVRPVGGAAINARIVFAFDDIMTITPTNSLLTNTTYEVVFPQDGIEDVSGNGMQAYSFTFSTGNSINGNMAPIITSFTPDLSSAQPGNLITFTTVASDPENTTMQYRFDFGDGTAKSNWQASGSINYTYNNGGHYRVSVQVKDTQGAISSSGFTQSVVASIPTNLPQHDTALLCDNTANRIWTVNPDNNSITALNMNTNVNELEISVCEDPRSITKAGNEIWLTCHDNNQIQIRNSLNGNLIQSINTPYGSAPMAIVANRTQTEIYVSYSGSGDLVKFNTSTHTQTGFINLGQTAHAIALDANGINAYVTRLISAENQAEIWQINTVSMSLTDTIIIDKYGSDDNRDTTSSGKGVANYLTDIVIAPDGQSAWITANKPNTDRGLLTGPDLDQDNSVRNLLIQIDLNSNQVIQTIDIDNSDSASAVLYSKKGDYLFVALQGNNEVMVLDNFLAPTVAGLGSLKGKITVQDAPQAMCVDFNNDKLVVKNFLTRSVSSIDMTDFSNTGNINFNATHTSTVTNESMSTSVLNGKKIFYNAKDPRMSAEGYLSCASCHLDGGHDGRIWDFTGRNEGLRNTKTLLGSAGMEHGNVHWTGNFDEIQDFENDIRNAQGGTGFLSNSQFQNTSNTLGNPKAGLNSDLDDLAAYVISLGYTKYPDSPFRNSNGSMSAAAIAGEQVYNTNGCNTCHSGNTFTDSSTNPPTFHDVGTIKTTSGQRLGAPLTGIDTPTLLGLWDSAPYLHDGSAKTIEDVFIVAGGIVIQAENLTLVGGSNYVIDYTDVNNDFTPRNAQFVDAGDINSGVQLMNIDGESGGIGSVSIRYSSSYHNSPAININVNGNNTIVNLQNSGNNPEWRFVNWGYSSPIDITLNAGTNNTITITSTDYSGFGIDEVLISPPSEVIKAQPHRLVNNLSSSNKNNLIQYLLQLDKNNVVIADLIFANGFE
jgi:DNA-binding beta-propeller fold protein YncE